jgi:tRNA(fMet)-specific endonuclease VapC
MYLLDTDTVIYSLKGDEAVTKNLHRHIQDPIKISIITLMELYYGAHRSANVASNLAKVKGLEAEFEVIPTGNESAEIFGMLKSRLERSGMRLDDFDLIIASCAMVHNLTLVTNNVAHFKRIKGLKLTNWSMPPR